MSRYIELFTSAYPRHQGDVRLQYPDMGQEFVLPETYAYVEWVDPPACDELLQRAEEVAPELVGGTWYMRWTVRDLTQEEIDSIARDNENRRKLQGQP